MPHVIIDRRPNSQGKNTVNKYRFLKRVKRHVSEAITKHIADNDVQIASSKGQKRNVAVPLNDLKEPKPYLSATGGVFTRVFTGNDRYVVGDRIPRPPSCCDGDGGGTPDGEGEDDFTFDLDDSDYFDILFSDCGLPNLEETVIAKSDHLVKDRAGFSKTGTPSRLNVFQTMKNAKTRRNALRTPKKKKLSALEERKEELEAFLEEIEDEDKKKKYTVELEELGGDILVLKKRLKRVPFIDDGDVRYNNFEYKPLPSTRAVMFCIMDVSISMGEYEKDIAKRFFVLLNYFLRQNYDDVDLVFISHTHIAKEVTEEEFFHSKETGGTVVSTGLEKASEIIRERYKPTEWNIFISQASDGDNWSYDNDSTSEVLLTKLLPVVRYYAYIEVSRGRMWGVSELWELYSKLSSATHNMAIARIAKRDEIYPVFKKLFRKKNEGRVKEKGTLLKQAKATGV